MLSDTGAFCIALIVAIVYGWPWWALLALCVLLALTYGGGRRRG